MLQALVALAERQGLLDDTSVTRRRVHFLLKVSLSTSPPELFVLGADGAGVELLGPPPPKRTQGVAAAFLVDNAQYVLAVAKGKHGRPPTDGGVQRAEHCLRAFARLITNAREATGDDGLIAVERFLLEMQEPSGRKSFLQRAPGHVWTGEENIAFIGRTLTESRRMTHAAISASSPAEPRPRRVFMLP